MAFALLERGLGRVPETSRTDDQLMASWRRGKRGAFDELYQRYKQPLYGYLVRNCGSETVADELFQDVWLRVISASGGFEGRGKFRSWLFSLAHNRLVDHYRKAENQAHNEPIGEDLTTGDNPGHEAGVHEQFARLQRIVKGLPLEQRQAFYLREECGFAVREIADIQGISVEAAKSRIRYAYGKLRNALGDESR